jgi:metallophosphoesterase (TIGR03767 family)
VQRHGSIAPYNSIVEFEGEAHTVRAELVEAEAAKRIARPESAIACIAHITDLHMTDVESPTRFEYINREYADPRFRELLPMQRAQEALNAHAIDALVRTINDIAGGPLTGSPLELVAMTGDAVDNAQWNELSAAIGLLEGALVQPNTGGPEYEGVQSPGWPDDLFWKPDGAERGEDEYRKNFGFPHHPGLLERALQPLHAAGLSLPWLGCHGNHEEVCQGVGVVNAALAAAAVHTRKPFRLPSGLDRDTVVDTFVRHPEAFMAGTHVEVTADAARRPFAVGEFIDAHFGSQARPDGHGFTEQNRAEGTAYYVHDTPAVRFITLDTACPAGGAEGCLSIDQLHWLERRLEEVHSSFRTRSGGITRTPRQDRLVVILSHHGLDALTNPRVHPVERGSGHVGPGELARTLFRFGNVVLWLNGHIHTNRIQPRTDPSGKGHGGFWEVTTASLVDWPCQGRIVELYDAGDGLLAIACTMVDHEGSEIAALHRELAGNAPAAGFATGRAGDPIDRNVILPLRAPFPLSRL